MATILVLEATTASSATMKDASAEARAATALHTALHTKALDLAIAWHLAIALHLTKALNIAIALLRIALGPAIALGLGKTLNLTIALHWRAIAQYLAIVLLLVSTTERTTTPAMVRKAGTIVGPLLLPRVPTLVLVGNTATSSPSPTSATAAMLSLRPMT